MSQSRTILRRLNRLGWLLANLGACVQFAGGAVGFLKRATRTLAAGQWRHLVAWMVMAVSYVGRTDSKRYRHWLARTAPAQPPDGQVSAVLASVGVPAGQFGAFLALISAQRKPWLDLVMVVEQGQRRQVEAHFEATGQQACIVDSEGNATSDLLRGLRRSIAESEGRVRYIALLAPGCIPGDMPLAAAGSTLLYGDEDEIDDRGERSRPLFKPAFSPDLLLYRDYMSSCLVLTTDLARSVAEQTEPAVADLHSLALVLTEAAERVEHVGAFTVHRLVPEPSARGSTRAFPSQQEPSARGGSRGLPPKKSTTAEIPEHLARHLRGCYGERATVQKTRDGWTCSFGSRDSGADRVSIIIPTRDRIDLLAPCIEGIHATNQGSFECIIIDNGSVAPETKRWLAGAPARFPALKVVEAPEPFNWSRLNNQGMRHAEGDVFLFLNNDTEAACEGWIDRLADVALRPDVGAVGGLLLYPDGLIQHAGVVTGFGGCADHIYVGTHPDAGQHMFVPPTVPRNVSAVTGACLAVARSTVDAIGGFDEGYRVVGSDVEFCIRAMHAGLRNVYLPDVRLVHHESQSRTKRDPEADVERLRAMIAQRPSDPYFNPKLSMISLYPSYPV
ncbi:MAG: glycosyltransferase family 2 protein [Gammaproteobacteria bacterium]|nr:glycosyltransferase family 2 protein [Gammaproteobacteria bacterium]